MADLLGANVGDNYEGILNLGNTLQQTIDNTLKPITDGTGVASSLSVSNTSAAINEIYVGSDGPSGWEPGVYNTAPSNINVSVNPGTIVVSEGYSTGSYVSIIRPDAIFEMASTTQGMLLPRMRDSERAAINRPTAGLVVYVTDAPGSICYYNGTNWYRIIGTQI
jgi:hypothetical protein